MHTCNIDEKPRAGDFNRCNGCRFGTYGRITLGGMTASFFPSVGKEASFERDRETNYDYPKCQDGNRHLLFLEHVPVGLAGLR